MVGKCNFVVQGMLQRLRGNAKSGKVAMIAVANKLVNELLFVT